MKYMKWLQAFWLTAFLQLLLPANISFATGVLPAQIKADEATRLYLFAEELYQTGQYYRALTEYQRFSSFYPDHELGENVMFKVGLCFYRGEKYRQGAPAFEDMNRKYPDSLLGREALLMAGECYRKAGLMSVAMDKFSLLSQGPIQDELTVKALYAMGLIYSENLKLSQARESFKKMEENPAYTELSRKMVDNIDKHKKAKKKSPVAAGILAIVPGLGHLYCERPGDALVSFLVNGLFTWGAVESFRQERHVVGGILAFFELGWYVGNIHSAVGSAYKYNRYQEKTFYDGLERNIDMTAPSASSAPSPALTISFDIPF